MTVQSAPPSITSASSATVPYNASFSYQITATNNPTSFGATGLPSGLTVDTNTGIISGATTASGTTTVTISASNATGAGTAILILAVQPPPPAIISPSSATVPYNASFSYQITATNNPTSYSAAGLPSGLTINTATGLISGVTTASGTSNVTIAASNVTGSGTALLVMTVQPAPPVISGNLTATVLYNAPFSYQITASSNPSGYGATGLPAGLSVNSFTGLISGVTTASGTSDVTISAVNVSGSTTATLVLTVQPPPPVISGSLAVTVPYNSYFTYQITASNRPTSYSATGLPSGLSVNSFTGIVSGVTTASGTANVTLSAINVTGTGTATLAMTVLPPPPVISGTLAATVPYNAQFSYQITASNSPTSYGATGLPNGLGLNVASGLITGVTTFSGTSNVTISAANTSGTGTAILVLAVQPPPPVITGTLAVTVPYNTPFSYQVTASNSPTSYGATGLPAGLAINTATGLISGATSASGTANATITASNVTGTGTATLLLAIMPPPPVIASALAASGVQGLPFTYQIIATNSPTAYGASGLPAGLNVTAGTGLISGTPTATGTFISSIAASNITGTGTAPLVITVMPQTGSLTVNITPAAAASAGARWAVDGGAWQTGGASLSGLLVGQAHTVTYLSVPGYTPPASQYAVIAYASTANLTGTYIGIPVISVRQPAGAPLVSGSSIVSFGTVTSGSSAYQTFTIANIGAANLTLQTPAVTGPDALEFLPGAPASATVAPGASTTLVVTYSPSDIHGSTATLDMKSNDTVWPSFLVGLAATGTSGPVDFHAGAGTFVGIVRQTGTFTSPATVAMAKFDLTTKARVTGKLYYQGGASISINGSFDSTGNFHGFPGGLALLLSSGFGGQGNPAGYWIDGALSLQNGPVPFKSFHAAYANRQPVAEAGKYTLLISSTSSDSSVPAGVGYGYATVNKTGGKVSLKGKLADGCGFAVSGILVSGKCGNQFMLFYPRLHSNQGLLAGSVVFETKADSDCDGAIEWMVPQSSGAFYAQGCDAFMGEIGARYFKPGRGVILPNFTHGTLILSDGGLASPISGSVAVTSQGQLVVNGANPNGLRINVNPSTGGISGSFLFPQTSTRVSFYGALYQNPSLLGADGFFIGPVISGSSSSGIMTLSP